MINPHSKEAKEFMIEIAKLYDLLHNSQVYAYNGLVKLSPLKYDCPMSHKSRAHFFTKEQDKDIVNQLNNVIEKANNLGSAEISKEDLEILNELKM